MTQTWLDGEDGVTKLGKQGGREHRFRSLKTHKMNTSSELYEVRPNFTVYSYQARLKQMNCDQYVRSMLELHKGMVKFGDEVQTWTIFYAT